MNKNEGPGGTTKPGNQKDIARFEQLSPEQKERVTIRAKQLYDGSRTIARCWKIALANTEASQ